jgi:pyridoxamine 5'-phosphate oxidase
MLENRMDYTHGTLDEAQMLEQPIAQLRLWIEDARDQIEPNAMTVSTVAQNGRPSSRVVLLRGLSEQGLTFYTNYESRKGAEIAATGAACLGFWWPALERQVRIEGSISRVAAEESDAYFASRPLESQLASAASPQSQGVTRNDLEARVAALRLEYPVSVPRPAHWGGYVVAPDYLEFWQGRKARLHDRIAYRLDNGVWQRLRLAP